MLMSLLTAEFKSSFIMQCFYAAKSDSPSTRKKGLYRDIDFSSESVPKEVRITSLSDIFHPRAYLCYRLFVYILILMTI